MVTNKFETMIWVQRVSLAKLGHPKRSSKTNTKVEEIADNLKETHQEYIIPVLMSKGGIKSSIWCGN